MLGLRLGISVISRVAFVLSSIFAIEVDAMDVCSRDFSVDGALILEGRLYCGIFLRIFS